MLHIFVFCTYYDMHLMLTINYHAVARMVQDGWETVLLGVHTELQIYVYPVLMGFLLGLQTLLALKPN